MNASNQLSILTAQLRQAEAREDEAKHDALQQGMDATQPLTPIRLGELCALGEKMHAAGIVRKQALARVLLVS